jgi:hypothetical protein
MARVDDSLSGLKTSPVTGHFTPCVKDDDFLLQDLDLDVLLHEPIGDAVAHGVHVHEAVGGDPPA